MMTEKNWRLYVAKCQNAQKTRAHARLSDFLSNAPYGLKRMQKKFGNDLEHFKFLRARKRAHKRVRADLRTFFDLKLTGRILILFMINMNEKLLSVMKI